MSDLSWLNPTPHAIAVYASQPLSPVATQHSLPSGRYSLLGPDFTSTGWIAPALPGAVESRTGAVAWAMWQHSVSCPRSSNRTCRFPASGFPTSFIVRPTAVAEAARVEAVEHRAPRKPEQGKCSVCHARAACADGAGSA